MKMLKMFSRMGLSYCTENTLGAADTELQPENILFLHLQNIWMQRLDRKWRLLYQDELVSESIEDYDAIPIEINEEKLEKTRLYQLHFLSLPADCQKILKMFLSKVSLKEFQNVWGSKTLIMQKPGSTYVKYLCHVNKQGTNIMQSICKKDITEVHHGTKIY